MSESVVPPDDDDDIKGIVILPEQIAVRRGAPWSEAKHHPWREQYKAWLASLTPEERAFAAMPAPRLWTN